MERIAALSWTTNKAPNMASLLEEIHPGEIPLEDFMTNVSTSRPSHHDPAARSWSSRTARCMDSARRDAATAASALAGDGVERRMSYLTIAWSM